MALLLLLSVLLPLAAAALSTGLVSNNDKLRIACVINCYLPDGVNILPAPVRLPPEFNVTDCR